MKRTLYIAGGFTLAFLMPFNLQAQNTQPKDTTMNRTVVVEQEYNPDILDASKVNVLPKVEEPTVTTVIWISLPITCSVCRTGTS